APNMVVQRSGALVEAAGVPRVAKPELLIIEVVAELVAQGVQECSKRTCVPSVPPYASRLGSAWFRKCNPRKAVAQCSRTRSGRAASTRIPHSGTLKNSD